MLQLIRSFQFVTQMCHVLQTGEFDAFLCKQELERLQRLEEEAAALELDKPRRESASTIDDFLQPGVSMSYVSPRTVHGPGEDDVFLRPPLWEDITSSIQKVGLPMLQPTSFL